MKRLLLLSGLVLFTGCSSYEAKVDRSHSLISAQNYFVVSNANDSRGIDHQIDQSLKDRGLTAERGPLTMMPDEAQAIVTYEDHWTWDFGDRLNYLQIIVRDRKTNRSFATVTFNATVPTSKPPADIVEGLIEKFHPKKP